MPMNLMGKRALVTGGARRLGAAISLALADAGCDIILHYNQSESDAQSLSAEISKKGRQCLITCHDLKKSDKTGKWFTGIADKTGGIDILVNNASTYMADNYSNISESSIRASMAIHLHSPLSMISNMYQIGRPGTVVNILDTRANSADSSHVSYHLGKSALMTATRELALKMAPEMRINGVAPGLILPPDGKDREWPDKLKESYPLASTGSVKDVCDAVLYLASAQFVTGQILYVDGGRHLKGIHHGY